MKTKQTKSTKNIRTGVKAGGLSTSPTGPMSANHNAGIVRVRTGIKAGTAPVGGIITNHNLSLAR